MIVSMISNFTGGYCISTETVNATNDWAAQEFDQVELHDVRLDRRCQDLADTLSQQPTAPINQACEDWAETKAAYRFFAHEKVTPTRIRASHTAHTVARMQQYPLVLAVQDTTFFNYTHHPQTAGLGEIGTKDQQQRGFGLHSTLAVTLEGMPLGLLTQAFFTRPVGEPAHTPAELHKLPIEEKESYRWLEAFEQTLALAPPDVQVLTVCDREADIYEMFVMAQEQEAPLLVRAAHNRRLAEPEVAKLRTKLEQQPVAGHLTVEITGNQKQAARTAEVTVRFTTVQLQPPWRPGGEKLPPVTLSAVLVREENPPADVKEPIEWLLLINRSVTDFEMAVQVVKWYGCRWQIEVFHKVLKSGCNVEDCRLQTATRLQNYIALMSVVAWRLQWLTHLSRVQPDLPCTVALTTVEWQALYMRIHHTADLPETIPTVHQAVRWIAQLGGFLGRRHDGEPGITVLWRGWQRLQDLTATWALVKEQVQTYG